jgi:hypothetical protein
MRGEWATSEGASVETKGGRRVAKVYERAREEGVGK